MKKDDRRSQWIKAICSGALLDKSNMHGAPLDRFGANQKLYLFCPMNRDTLMSD